MRGKSAELSWANIALGDGLVSFILLYSDRRLIKRIPHVSTATAEGPDV